MFDSNFEKVIADVASTLASLSGSLWRDSSRTNISTEWRISCAKGGLCITGKISDDLAAACSYTPYIPLDLGVSLFLGHTYTVYLSPSPQLQSTV